MRTGERFGNGHRVSPIDMVLHDGTSAEVERMLVSLSCPSSTFAGPSSSIACPFFLYPLNSPHPVEPVPIAIPILDTASASLSSPIRDSQCLIHHSQCPTPYPSKSANLLRIPLLSPHPLISTPSRSTCLSPTTGRDGGVGNKFHHEAWVCAQPTSTTSVLTLGSF